MVVRLPSMHTDSPGFNFPGHKKSAITNFLNPTFCNAYRRIFRDGEMAPYVKHRPCKWGPEFEHLEPIKTRHTVQVSVIPALVPRDRRWKQNCKLTGQLTWHTLWEKNKETRSPEGWLRGLTRRLSSDLYKGTTPHMNECALTHPSMKYSSLLQRCGVSLLVCLSEILFLALWLPHTTFQIKKTVCCSMMKPWKDSKRKKPGTQRP